MTSFDARLRLPGEAAAPLGVEVDLTGERMAVTVGRNHIANWALSDIKVSPGTENSTSRPRVKK